MRRDRMSFEEALSLIPDDVAAGAAIAMAEEMSGGAAAALTEQP